MDSRFAIAFGGWYLLFIDLIMIVGIIYFLKLPKGSRANSYYWLPLFILIFSVFYENLAAYTNFNFEFKKNVNVLLGNTENPRYNIWVYNIFNQQLLTLVILFLLRSYLPVVNKKIINWLMFFFIGIIIVLTVSGVEPIYGSRPLIFAISASLILISCGIYFISFMTDNNFLQSNPLRLASFWQATFLLFYYSAIFLKTISQQYLWTYMADFSKSLNVINTSLWILLMITMILPLTASSFKLNLEKEPSHA
jgi:hypothetical protein